MNTTSMIPLVLLRNQTTSFVSVVFIKRPLVGEITYCGFNVHSVTMKFTLQWHKIFRCHGKEFCSNWFEQQNPRHVVFESFALKLNDMYCLQR